MKKRVQQAAAALAEVKVSHDRLCPRSYVAILCTSFFETQ
eukprot:SAG22_NODE_15468_length_348_cov_0.831325_1_plen_39_part_10